MGMLSKQNVFHKGGNDMSMNSSRRDFLKCTGITVLAVGMGSLLTGCGGGGSGSGTAGVNTPLTIDGITVKVTGFEQEAVTAEIAGVAGTDTNHKFLFPEVTVRNESGKIFRCGGASNFALKVDGQEQSYVSLTVANLLASAYGHELLDKKSGYSIPDQNECSGALAYVVPTGWKQAELRFFPDLSDTSKFVTFILTNR